MEQPKIEISEMVLIAPCEEGAVPEVYEPKPDPKPEPKKKSVKKRKEKEAEPKPEEPKPVVEPEAIDEPELVVVPEIVVPEPIIEPKPVVEVESFEKVYVEPVKANGIFNDDSYAFQKLEEKAAKAQEALEKEEKLRKDLEALNSKLLAEKTALLDSLSGEKGALSDYQEKCAKLAAQKNDLDNQLRVSILFIIIKIWYIADFATKNIDILMRGIINGPISWKWSWKFFV